MWQGERGQCESESTGAHVCHYVGLPVCWFTLSLPIAKIPYYKTQRYNHKTYFFLNLQREMQTSCTSFCCRILRHCGNFGTHALQVIHSMCTVSLWDSFTLITTQKTLISFDLPWSTNSLIHWKLFIYIKQSFLTLNSSIKNYLKLFF